MNKIYFGILLLSIQAIAQPRAINGAVKDMDTKEPVPYCAIQVINSTIGTTTDIYGKFALFVPDTLADYRIAISSIGFKSDTVKLIPSQKAYLFFLQSTSNVLNEVVITGVSRATLVRENPVSIVLIPLKKIEQATESNIIDVLVKNTPGLNAMKTGPNISKPFIRGLGFNRVLTLYDGVRQEGQQWGHEHGMEIDPYNIEKAEVIKGPASLLFGSDALAGVVSLFPAIPHQVDKKLHGSLYSEFQSNNGLFGNGLRMMYANEYWAFALRGSYRIAKNYRNNVDGRIYNTGFQEANASAFASYTGKNGYSNLNLTIYNDLQGIPDGSRDSITRWFTRQVYEGNKDDIKKRPLVTDAELNSYSLSPLHQHIQHYRIYSNNHYEMRKGDINFSVAFQQNIRREYNHPTQILQPGLSVRLNTLNYGLRFNLSSFHNMEVSLGINGMYQNNKNKNATDFPIPNYNLYDAGTFIYAKWKSEKFVLSGGLRYDIRYLSGADFYTKTNANTGFEGQVSIPDTVDSHLLFPQFKKTFNGLSASIGATFRVNDKISIKTNIGRGYRAPNITEFASNGLDPGAHIFYLGNRNFVPEFSLQEDIGISGSFTELSASLSLFNNIIQHYIYLTQLTDAQGSPLVDAQGNKTFQYQQAKAQLYGGEANLDLHPKIIKGFNFNNSLSVLWGYNRKREYKNHGINGAYLPLIPPLKLISSLSQELKTKSKILPKVNLKFELDFNAAQHRFLSLNDTESPSPGYSLMNAGIDIDINYRKTSSLKFLIQVNNLLDVDFQSNMSRLKYFEYYYSSPNGHLGIYGMGRNICFKLIAPF